MAQVICTSKHAQIQPQIGGVKFFSSEVGRISEEITDDLAQEFVSKTPTFFRLHIGEPIEEVKKVAKKVTGVTPKSVGAAAQQAGNSTGPTF